MVAEVSAHCGKHLQPAQQAFRLYQTSQTSQHMPLHTEHPLFTICGKGT